MKIPLAPIFKWIAATLLTAALEKGADRLTKAVRDRRSYNPTPEGASRAGDAQVASEISTKKELKDGR